MQSSHLQFPTLGEARAKRFSELLRDRSYERRKLAASELMTGPAELAEFLAQSSSTLRSTIREEVFAFLLQFTTTTSDVNARKGGLVALATCAIRDHDLDEAFLRIVLNPVLFCLQHDADEACRGYASEALFNLLRRFRGRCLFFFTEMFLGIMQLSVAQQTDLVVIAHLEKLLRDVVVEELGKLLKAAEDDSSSIYWRARNVVMEVVSQNWHGKEATPTRIELDYVTKWISVLVKHCAAVSGEVAAHAGTSSNNYKVIDSVTDLILPLIPLLDFSAPAKATLTFFLQSSVVARSAAVRRELFPHLLGYVQTAVSTSGGELPTSEQVDTTSTITSGLSCRHLGLISYPWAMATHYVSGTRFGGNSFGSGYGGYTVCRWARPLAAAWNLLWRVVECATGEDAVLEKYLAELLDTTWRLRTASVENEVLLELRDYLLEEYYLPCVVGGREAELPRSVFSTDNEKGVRSTAWQIAQACLKQVRAAAYLDASPQRWLQAILSQAWLRELVAPVGGEGGGTIDQEPTEDDTTIAERNKWQYWLREELAPTLCKNLLVSLVDDPQAPSTALLVSSATSSSHQAEANMHSVDLLATVFSLTPSLRQPLVWFVLALTRRQLHDEIWAGVDENAGNDLKLQTLKTSLMERPRDVLEGIAWVRICVAECVDAAELFSILSNSELLGVQRPGSLSSTGRASGNSATPPVPRQPSSPISQSASGGLPSAETFLRKLKLDQLPPEAAGDAGEILLLGGGESDEVLVAFVAHSLFTLTALERFRSNCLRPQTASPLVAALHEYFAPSPVSALGFAVLLHDFQKAHELLSQYVREMLDVHERASFLGKDTNSKDLSEDRRCLYAYHLQQLHKFTRLLDFPTFRMVRQVLSGVGGGGGPSFGSNVGGSASPTRSTFPDDEALHLMMRIAMILPQEQAFDHISERIARVRARNFGSSGALLAAVNGKAEKRPCEVRLTGRRGAGELAPSQSWRLA